MHSGGSGCDVHTGKDGGGRRNSGDDSDAGESGSGDERSNSDEHGDGDVEQSRQCSEQQCKDSGRDGDGGGGRGRGCGGWRTRVGGRRRSELRVHSDGDEQRAEQRAGSGGGCDAAGRTNGERASGVDGRAVPGVAVHDRNNGAGRRGADFCAVHDAGERECESADVRSDGNIDDTGQQHGKQYGVDRQHADAQCGFANDNHDAGCGGKCWTDNCVHGEGDKQWAGDSSGRKGNVCGRREIGGGCVAVPGRTGSVHDSSGAGKRRELSVRSEADNGGRSDNGTNVHEQCDSKCGSGTSGHGAGKRRSERDDNVLREPKSGRSGS